MFYEGHGLRGESRLIGNAQYLQHLMRQATTNESSSRRIILLTGIGGVG